MVGRRRGVSKAGLAATPQNENGREWIPAVSAVISYTDRSSNWLSRVAMRLHAAGVRGLGLLIILVDVVQAIQGPAHGPDETTDRGALPSAFAAACYSTSCCPNGCTSNASDGNVLHHLDGLIPLTRRRGCVLVTRLYCRLGWDRRCRTWARGRSRRSGRGLRSWCRVGHLFDGFGPRPVRDDDTGDDGRDDHNSHSDRGQLPRVVPAIVHLELSLPQIGTCPTAPPAFGPGSLRGAR